MKIFHSTNWIIFFQVMKKKISWHLPKFLSFNFFFFKSWLLLLLTYGRIYSCGYICISLVRLDIFSYSRHLVSSLVTHLFKSFSYWLVGGLHILWTFILCWYCVLQISSPSPWLSFIFTLFWWEVIEDSWIYQHFPLW